MKPFRVKIVTPDGLRYDGHAEELVVRTTTGDLGILGGHINCVAPLGMGQAMMVSDGKKRYAACIGGMVSVMDNTVSVVATTFEWADQIDTDRARASEDRAKNMLSNKNASSADLCLAEARLKRALIRQSVAKHK